MPRLFFIAVILVGVAGCSSQHAFKGWLNGAAPIAGTESYYALVTKKVTTNNVTRRQLTLTRFEPDGSSRAIREVDTLMWIEEQLATDTVIVVTKEHENTRYLFSVASGELSPLPEGYTYEFNWQKVSKQTRDSLEKTPLLKDIAPWLIYPLYAEDCYLVAARVEGSGICVADFDGGHLIGFGMLAPKTYFMVANMKKKTLTKIPGENMLSLSASEKSVLVLCYEDGEYSSQIVKFEDVLE